MGLRVPATQVNFREYHWYNCSPCKQPTAREILLLLRVLIHEITQNFPIKTLTSIFKDSFLLMWVSNVCAQLLSHVPLFETPWTVAHQAPLSMGIPRQEHWSRLLFPSSGDSSPPRD